MKKIVAVLLAALLLVGVMAVGVSAEETTTTTANSVAPQRVAVTLTASFNADGTLTVKAVDANGAPVSGYRVDLVLQGMQETVYTNDQGVKTSMFDVDEGKTATFEGLETHTASAVYEACAKKTLTRPSTATTTLAPVTTTVSAETTTTVSGDATTTVAEETTTEQQAAAPTGTTASTTATVKGNSTTAVEDDRIAMNALTDTALLEGFGLTRQEFLSKARLLVSEEDYKKLVGRTGNTPMLGVRTSVTEVTPTMVQAALSNVSEFSGYSEDQRQIFSFDLSLLMISRAGKDVPVTALPEDVLYTVQLPIPTEMKKSTAFAITVMDGDELMTPQTLEVKNGMFELKINSLETYTLIGFGEKEEESAGGLSWRLIVLLIAGILLIAGAGLLLYFFVFRKPEEVKEAQTEQETAKEDSDTDIYSGRTDNTWEPEDN
ncbi:MAG: hypothetical protein IJO75_05065 [Clostridia bacterium]|nr:hypothetical protein [Clostridia bacterium]